MFTDGIPVPQTADLIVNVYAFLQHWNRLLQLRGQELLLQLHEMKNQSCRGNWAMGASPSKSRIKCGYKLGENGNSCLVIRVQEIPVPSGAIFIFMILFLTVSGFLKKTYNFSIVLQSNCKL